MRLKPEAAEETAMLRELLEVSHLLPLKVWRQVGWLKGAGIATAAVAGAGVLGGVWAARKTPLPSVGTVATAGAVLAGAWAALQWLDKNHMFHKRLGEIGFGALLGTLGWPVARLHLKTFDKLFLEHGAWPPKPKKTAAPITAKLRES